MGRQVGKALGVRLHVLVVDQVLVDEDLEHPVEQGDVRPRANRQMEVGHHRRLRDPGVDHDHGGPVVVQHPRGEQRVVVGDVGPEEEDAVGGVEVGVGPRRAVAAEALLVAGHGARHAQGGVAVVVADAEAEPGQLAEGVELLGHQLPGGEDGDGVGTVLGQEPPELADGDTDRLVPGRRFLGTALTLANLWGEEPAVGGDDVVLGQPFGTEASVVHRMLRVAHDADRLVAADAEQHAAADRAVATRRSHPAVGTAARIHHAALLVGRVARLVPSGGQAEQPGHARPPRPAHRLVKKLPATR
jgi:hypothetical protein